MNVEGGVFGFIIFFLDFMKNKSTKKKWENLHEPKMNFTIERKSESSIHRCVPVICMVGNLLEQARPFLQTYFLNKCDH